MLEAPTPWELSTLLAVTPWLSKMPSGDGHPVIVYPGLSASDISALAIHSFLHQEGYTPDPWGQGFNLGPRGVVLER